MEQIDIKTNDVLRIWAKAEDASATLQLPIEHIRQLLNGEYNEEIGDQVGGYKWRFAAEDAIVTATGSGRGSKKGKKNDEAARALKLQREAAAREEQLRYEQAIKTREERIAAADAA